MPRGRLIAWLALFVLPCGCDSLEGLQTLPGSDARDVDSAGESPQDSGGSEAPGPTSDAAQDGGGSGDAGEGGAPIDATPLTDASHPADATPLDAGDGSCALPWGGRLANAGSVQGYSTSSVACHSSCALETRKCISGVLSGSYTNQSCAPSCAACAGSAVAWAQQQAAWAGNSNTGGTYGCTGTVQGASHGTLVAATLTGTHHVGSASYTCDDGSWVLSTHTCDGQVVTTQAANGAAVECSGLGVRGLWMSWYLSDLARCGDSAGLDFWVAQYNGSTTTCQSTTNYDGYGTKDACWRAAFQSGAGACYTEVASTGHVCAVTEPILCGSAAYPWGKGNVAIYGTSCKYPPP